MNEIRFSTDQLIKSMTAHVKTTYLTQGAFPTPCRMPWKAIFSNFEAARCLFLTKKENNVLSLSDLVLNFPL